jgi:hypothetical protein
MIVSGPFSEKNAATRPVLTAPGSGVSGRELFQLVGVHRQPRRVADESATARMEVSDVLGLPARAVCGYSIR